MFFACGICCLADVSNVSPSSEQTRHTISTFVDQTHIQCTRPRIKTVFFFKTSLAVFCLNEAGLNTGSVHLKRVGISRYIPRI